MLLEPLDAEELREDRLFELGLRTDPPASAAGRVPEGLGRCHGPISAHGLTWSPAPARWERVDDTGSASPPALQVPWGGGTSATRWASRAVSPTSLRATMTPMLTRFVALVAAVALLAIAAACTPGASSGVPSQTPASSAASVVVDGLVHAGPICPVEKVPADPACADRPVAGAVLIVTTAAGVEVARATSAADGTFRVTLPAGDYILVPQPVQGYIGTASPIPFHAQGDGAPRRSTSRTTPASADGPDPGRPRRP